MHGFTKWKNYMQIISLFIYSASQLGAKGFWAINKKIEDITSIHK